MESPVMTSAPSHRLRSAVSACAQPTHSYLSTSQLGSSIQVESHDSGGCFKKFKNSARNGGDSPLSIARKSGSGGDFSPLRRRHKITSRHGSNHRRTRRNGKEVENSASGGVLNLIPKQLMLEDDFLSKLKFSGKLIESKKLADYLGKSPRNESGVNPCGQVVGGKSGHKTGKRNASDRVLNHRHNNCEKGKSKRSGSGCAKDRVGERSEQCSDECSKCGGLHLGEGVRDERDEISKWQPKHVVTRRTAQIVREIRNVLQSRVGSSNSLSGECVRTLFKDSKDLQLPSDFRVSEMLEYAKECPENPSLKSVTFGDFRNLKKSEKQCKVARASPRTLEKNDEKRARKFSKGMTSCQVFLGGSCNPTTWRTDFAIPEFDKLGITYYNPQQVDEWQPELMEAEYHAKENAKVMFFVLDNQTRGVSALIEVAHLAGNRRMLILVIQSYTQKNQIICDEEISKEEYEDLKRGQEVLQCLVERQGIPVFNSIQVALEYTKKILKENLRVQDLQAPPVHVNRENSTNPREVFEKLGSGSQGEISAGDACVALKILTGVDVPLSGLKNFISKGGFELNGTLLGDVKFDFECFSQLVAEVKRRQEVDRSEDASLDLTSTSGPSSCQKDVYLGGTIENTSWRDSVAIPALEEQNLSYFVPKINEGGNRFTEFEAAAMDASCVLLFVITNTARSIAAMAIAGHYIGKGANVVLCVEHLPENATVGREKLSENAVKDYNRGRMYLMDIAKRSNVPVFDDISTAVKFVIQKCRNRERNASA